MGNAELRRQLETNRAMYDSAGLTDEVAAVDARIKELDKNPPPEEPAPAAPDVPADALVTVTPASSVPADTDLSKLKVADLKALAAARGVELKTGMKKAQIRRALERA